MKNIICLFLLVPVIARADMTFERATTECQFIVGSSLKIREYKKTGVAKEVVKEIYPMTESFTGYQRHFLGFFVDKVYSSNTTPTKEDVQKVFMSGCLLQMGTGYLELPPKKHGGPNYIPPYKRYEVRQDNIRTTD